jgi:hypothetical protein
MLILPSVISFMMAAHIGIAYGFGSSSAQTYVGAAAANKSRAAAMITLIIHPPFSAKRELPGTSGYTPVRASLCRSLFINPL